jgi:hypothetical protein
MSFTDRTVRVLEGREHYAADHALVVRQNTDDQETTLQIRRVMCGGCEELQIEIGIVKTGKKRNTHAYSSFVVSPQIADLIATACKEMRS